MMKVMMMMHVRVCERNENKQTKVKNAKNHNKSGARERERAMEMLK
jgi:hypothetical protein